MHIIYNKNNIIIIYIIYNIHIYIYICTKKILFLFSVGEQSSALIFKCVFWVILTL